jgi:Fibronectin type III-like domain
MHLAGHSSSQIPLLTTTMCCYVITCTCTTADLAKSDHRRVTPRYKLLRGFHKVDLAAGASEQLHWTLHTEDLSYIGVDYKPVLEASTVWFTVGHETDCRLQQQQQFASASDGSCVTLHITPTAAYRYVSQL